MDGIVNPYIAGAPVTEQRMFFGRDDVFNWIQNSLTGQYADHILVIHGQRRVGKTSVLKQLGNRLPQRYLPVFFDLQGRTHTTLDRFLWGLAREIVRTLKQDRGIDFPLPDKQAFASDIESFEHRFIADFKSVLGDTTLLLTFDEFDNLEESQIKEDLARPLIDYLRGLIGNGGVNFIFSIGSSGRKLENMQAAYTEFFKTALYKKISFLDEEQTRRLIVRPVKNVIGYDAPAIARIFQIAGGHPYFTQLTCHELFAKCQQTDSRTIKEADVESVLDDIVERGTVNLKFVWDEASDIEKWSLAALAHLDKADNRTLGDFLRKQRIRFSESDLTSGLLHLREKDVLTPDNRFVIHLLKLWLQKNRPIEQVREELTEVNPIANRYIEIGMEFKNSRVYDKAIESFQEALGIAKDNIQAQVNIALTYMDQKAYDKAVAEFEKALKMDNEDVSARAGLCEAHLALGDVAMQKKRPKDAILSYQRVLAINAEHTEARGRMAEIARQSAEKSLADGKDEEALSAFAAALKFTPEDPILIARLERVRLEKKAKILAALLSRSEKEAEAKNWEGAIKPLEEASLLAPEDGSIQNKLNEIRAAQEEARLESLLAKADAAMRSERWNEAIEALTIVLLAWPGEILEARLAETRARQREARLNELQAQAQRLARVERFDEALSAWEAYLALEPAGHEAVQAEIGETRKAQALAKSYVEAQRAFAKKNYDQTVGLLKEIISHDEDYKDASMLLAEAIELRRTTRRWWQNKWLWGMIVGLIILAVGWFALKPLMNMLSTRPTQVDGSTQIPSDGVSATITPMPTATAAFTPVPLSWARLNSGQFLSRASITSIVFDPTDPGVMYVSTDGAGIYKSLDGGLSWQPVLNGLGRSEVSSLINDPQEPDTLYAGALLGGVYKTEDGAQTWHPINHGIELRGGAYLATVAMDPTNHNHLYFTDSLGLYETTDGGEKWTKLPVPACPKIISSMVIPAGTSNVIYIADRGKSADCSAGIYRSRNGGKTWDFIPVGVSQFIQLHYWSMAVASEPQERIYVSGEVAGEDKLYRTPDEGKTWEAILEHRCFATKIDPSLNGRMFCGGPDRLRASPDWGDSWAPFLDERSIWDVAVSPHSVDTLIAGGSGSGLFISNDGGTEWNEQDSGLGGTYLSLSLSPIDQATMFAEGGYSTYRSTNSGQAWDLLTHEGRGLAFDPGKKIMYILSDVILKSGDEGKTWQRMAKTNQDISSFVTHPQISGMVIAIHESGFSLSMNGGESWDERNNIAWKGETEQIVGKVFTSLIPDKAGVQFYILINSETTGKILRLNGVTGDWSVCQTPANVTTVNLLAIDPRDSNRTIISSPGNGLLTSVDGCQTWRESNNGLESLFVNTLVIDQNHPDTIYAGTDGGAYISADGGQTWGQINDGLLGATVVYSIVVDSDGNVYAATPYGIFKLENKNE